MVDKADLKAIKRVLKGDADAFGEIVERYGQMVYKICLRFMKNEVDAADMAQEVFISAYNNLDRFSNKCLISTWLYRICANICLNQLKKQQRLNFNLNIDEHQVFHDDNPGELLEMDELKKLVEGELEKMGEMTKSVTKLRIFGEKTFPEIARLLGIPASSARTYFTRSRKRLKVSISLAEKESDFK